MRFLPAIVATNSFVYFGYACVCVCVQTKWVQSDSGLSPTRAAPIRSLLPFVDNNLFKGRICVVGFALRMTPRGRWDAAFFGVGWRVSA
jgi:hypothetical protein